MLSRVVRGVHHDLPAPVARVGFWMYTTLYVPTFASKKRAYDFGDFAMILDQSESTMMIHRRFRYYESDVADVISNSIGRGSTYVDIGSNKGYHLLAAARIVGDEGLVCSFEPNPDNFADLSDNIELNDFENVRAYQKAVYNHCGTSSFSFREKSGHGSVSSDGDIEVETTTFDDFLRDERIPPEDIDCIKVDVEGGEASVVAGMTEFLRDSDGCTIVIEVHRDADTQRMSRILHETGCDFEHSDHHWIVTT